MVIVVSDSHAGKEVNMYKAVSPREYSKLWDILRCYLLCNLFFF